ncbi:hypothetical protein Tco_1265723 [Tanacetum coccineum]
MANTYTPLLQELSRAAGSHDTKDQFSVLFRREVVEDSEKLQEYRRLSGELREAVRMRDGYINELKMSDSSDEVLKSIEIMRCMQLDDMEKASRLLLMAKETQVESIFNVALLRNSSGDSGTDLSFDKSASLERLFGLARASFVAHWKSGFFLIDRRAIPDAMVWRYPDADIDDPMPAAGSFNMANVRRLSAHVIKLRDMPKGVLVLSGLSRVWKNRFCDPMLRGANGNVMGIHDFFCLPEWTGAEVQEEPHLDVIQTLSKGFFIYFALPQLRGRCCYPNPTHRGSCRWVFLAQSSSSTNRPNLFVGDSDDESDGDDDACVEIPLVTPLRFAAVIPSSGNQDSQGKGIMVDNAVAPTGGVIRDKTILQTFLQTFSLILGCFQVIQSYWDPFPFSAVPYYATYPGMSQGPRKERKKKIKYLGKSLDNLHVEVARLSVALNQATILEAKRDEEILRLKTTPSDAGIERGLSMHWTKDEFADVLKKMVNFIPGAQERLTKASPFLEPKKLVRLANVPILRDTRVSPPIAKESTMTPVSNSLELSANVVPASFAIALEQNEEQGTSHVLDDVTEVTVVGSERVSSGLTDVVVALSAGEKGDGSASSSTVEEVIVPPSRV